MSARWWPLASQRMWPKQAVAARIEGFKAASQRENYDHAASVARLLEIPFLNIHSPLDEVGRRIMQRTVDEQLARKPDSTVADVRDALMQLPEFAAARTQMQNPLGSWDAPAGRVVVSHGAYTNGGYPVARAYLTHGVEHHLLHPLSTGRCTAAGQRRHAGQHPGDGPYRGR